MYSLSVPCLNHGPPKMSLQINCFWVAPFDCFFLGGASCGGKRRKSRPVAVRFDVAESGLEVNVPSGPEKIWEKLSPPISYSHLKVGCCISDSSIEAPGLAFEAGDRSHEVLLQI